MTDRKPDNTRDRTVLGPPVEPKTQFLGYAVREQLPSSEPPTRRTGRPRTAQPSAPPSAPPVRSPAERTQLEIRPQPQPQLSQQREPQTQLVRSEPAVHVSPILSPSVRVSTSTLPLAIENRALTHGRPSTPTPEPMRPSTPTPLPALRPFFMPGNVQPTTRSSDPLQLTTTHINPALASQPQRPQLALDEREITEPQLSKSKLLPIALGIALIALLAAGGIAGMRVYRARNAQVAATAVAQPVTAARSASAQAAPAPPDPAQQAVEAQAAAPQAVEGASAEAQPAANPLTLDDSSIAALEKNAIDRLLANDHRAALALYQELQRAAPKQEAYAAMTALLVRRTRPTCEGGARCDAP